MIARFFKEIGRVDELGSAVRNTHKYCGIYTPGTEPECIEGDVFKAIIPIQSEQLNGQPTGEAAVEVTGEVQMVVDALQGEMKLKELMDALDLSHRENFKTSFSMPKEEIVNPSKYCWIKFRTPSRKNSTNCNRGMIKHMNILFDDINRKNLIS